MAGGIAGVPPRCHSPGVMLSRRTAVAAFIVVVAGATGVAVQRAQSDTACERYQAVVADVERAERQGGMTFEESQRQLAEGYAACLQEQSTRDS